VLLVRPAVDGLASRKEEIIYGYSGKSGVSTCLHFIKLYNQNCVTRLRIQCQVSSYAFALLTSPIFSPMSRDSSVGIATCYGLGDRGVGVRVPIGSRIFSTLSRPVLGPTQPPIQWVPEALSPAAKRRGREADHSTLTSAEVKQMWIYTSTPPYASIA
jgi:hypothetical protein